MNRKPNKRSRLIQLALMLSVALMMVPPLILGGADTNVLVTVADAALVPATVMVDCDAGDKLQTKLNAASPGDTLTAHGVCNENITVRDEAARITIDGQGSATIHGPSSAAATVTVLGRNITIKGFTITGGRQGISVLRGGSALIDSNTIQESAGIGIIVLQIGHARIVNNTIQFNPGGGISVQENSFARIGFLDLGGPALGNIVRKNGVSGVIVQSTSGAALVGNSVSENDGPGVSVKGASQSHLAANHIDNNAADGVSVSQNSYVQLGGEAGILNAPNDTQVPNVGFGLRVSLNSSVGGRLATLSGADGAKKFDRTSTDALEDQPPNNDRHCDNPDKITGPCRCGDRERSISPCD
jgi:parallel beta-helix repeat protein